MHGLRARQRGRGFLSPVMVGVSMPRERSMSRHGRAWRACGGYGAALPPHTHKKSAPRFAARLLRGARRSAALRGTALRCAALRYAALRRPPLLPRRLRRAHPPRRSSWQAGGLVERVGGLSRRAPRLFLFSPPPRTHLRQRRRLAAPLARLGQPGGRARQGRVPAAPHAARVPPARSCARARRAEESDME